MINFKLFENNIQELITLKSKLVFDFQEKEKLIIIFKNMILNSFDKIIIDENLLDNIINYDLYNDLINYKYKLFIIKNKNSKINNFYINNLLNKNLNIINSNKDISLIIVDNCFLLIKNKNNFFYSFNIKEQVLKLQQHYRV